MSDADPGDLFLRHRGAILDALLSDPFFGYVRDDGADEPAADPVDAVSAPSGVAVPPIDDSLFVTGESDSPESFDDDGVSTFGSAAAAGGTSPRRSSVGPSASERINALLSGQAPAAGADFGPDYAQAAADRINREAQDQQESTEQSATAAEPAPAAKPSPQQVVQEVATELRKPKVALAVAAVVALLIVILLVFTGGEKEQPSRPLAVTPAPTSAAPPVEVAETGGTLTVESADAKCPPGSTDGMDAFSGEPDKAWSCVRSYKVDGQILRIDLGKEYEVDSIGIVPGWDHVGSDGTDQWTKFRTVSRVSYEFNNDDKTTYTQETLDQRSLVVTKIAPPVKASEIVLTVLKSGGEASANTVAISSIVITGK